MRNLIVFLISTALPLCGQDAKSGPAAHHPLVDIRGTIKQVHLEMGGGMPSLDIETANGPVKLILGSMRYLMQNDFSPKAGEAITARAYREETHLLAKSIELPASGKSLKLRDEEGKPLWRGSMGGMKGMSGMQCKDCKAMQDSKAAVKQ